MEKARDIGDISEEFQPLLNHALEMMNEPSFEYYLSWKGKRYKNKWDIVKLNRFKAFYSSYDATGEIAFYPDRLEIKLPNTGWEPGFVIPIDECEKMFKKQGKETVAQESLF